MAFAFTRLYFRILQGLHADGASLHMWKSYFRRGIVYGIDEYDKVGLEEARIRPIIGNSVIKRWLSYATSTI
jgi:hypothetical protein